MRKTDTSFSVINPNKEFV